MLITTKLRFVKNELKTSQQGNTYRIITLIDEDADKIVARADISDETNFEPLTPVIVDLSIKLGKFVNIKLLDLKVDDSVQDYLDD